MIHVEPTVPQPSRFLDPATLTRISSLELVARTVVEGFIAGLHRSPHLGFSVNFAEYRHYRPGDDIRKTLEFMDTRTPALGAQVVARAWTDPEFKKRLLAVAKELFARYGYDAVSVRDITSRAKANLGAITYHFGSKEALYHAALESMAGPFGARIAELAAAIYPGSASYVRRITSRPLRAFILEPASAA